MTKLEGKLRISKGLSRRSNIQLIVAPERVKKHTRTCRRDIIKEIISKNLRGRGNIRVGE